MAKPQPMNDPWNVVFAIYVITLAYSVMLSIGQLPNQHRPLIKCDKHLGTDQCACPRSDNSTSRDK